MIVTLIKKVVSSRPYFVFDIEKAERQISPGYRRKYSSINADSEVFDRKEIYASQLFIVRVRTVL